MDRAKLLATLKLVAPALSNKTFLPILTHLCSDGKRVFAYDDVVALRIPCDLGFQGAVPGERLLSLLASSRATSVECLVEEQEVLFKLGRTKIRFPLLPLADFLFDEPDRDGVSLVVDGALRQGLSIAGRSAGQDSAFAARLGVTLSFEKKRLLLYASDNTTMVRVVLPNRVPGLVGKNLILLPRFYDLLLKLGKDSTLVVTEKGDTLGLGEGIELFGHVLPGGDPGQFETVFTRSDLEQMVKAPVPKTLAHCLERAMTTSKESTEFSYADGRLGMLTKDASCELRDSVKIDLGARQQKVRTGAEYLLRYLDVTENIGIGSGCIFLEGKGFQALVSVVPCE